MHLNNIFSLDNRTCTDVIYGGYLLSYSRDISDALNDQIWEQSRCSSCINITFHFPDKPTYKMLDQTQIWEDKYLNFQQCVDNVTAYDEWAFRNGTTICQTCKDPLENLFNYFWKIYIDPDTDFCVDVETIMNDTMHLWNDVWKCADTKDRKKDRPLMIITLIVLIIFTLLFYSASYIQGGGRQRNFILYSGMPVVEERARLLSTSASGSDLAVVNFQRSNRIRAMSHKEEPLNPDEDQLTQYRERCAGHVEKLKEILDECNDRVNSRTETEETCHQEMMDYIHELDHCVGDAQSVQGPEITITQIFDFAFADLVGSL
ncbi:hypothetical protein WR25_01346 [Diploscapter pachys]|uniref:Ubiquinol-cytochrome C reductase hinge domain-containing protein n=1 Tax=Diploscapter pachys TaxID=2018661 RepID=A0A2A2JHF4_9BILA|nr:hypothetical protein WR25_01346 [Diploscapter pachys]